MKLAVLGSLQLRVGGASVPLGGTRQRRLLVALAQSGPQGGTVDELAEVIWGDHDRPADYGSHVRTAVNRLRRMIATACGDPQTEAIVTEVGRYSFNPDRVEVDLWKFTELLAQAREGHFVPVDVLSSALALWRGPPFDEFNELEPLASAVAKLEETRLKAEEDLAELWLDSGHPERVLERVAPLIRDQPYRERLQGAHVVALYQTGRQVAALRELNVHRQRMATELGLSPSPDLEALEQRILDQDETLQITGVRFRSLRGYQLGKRRGTGLDSEVYEALQPTLNRNVAVKITKDDHANSAEFIAHFQREATRVSRFEHPLVVPLHDYWREPGHTYLVSRLLSHSASDLLSAEGPLPVERVASIVRDIASGLASAHRVGIVHGAIKASNVLFDDDGRAYLADFGLSLQPKAAPRSDHEFAVGNSVGDLDQRKDIRDLGRLCLVLLAGQDASMSEPGEQLRAEAVPPSVVDCILRALKQDLGPQLSADEFAAEFTRASGGSSDFSDTAANPELAPVITGVTRNPYRGLAPFESADQDVFAGRTKMVAELIEIWSVQEQTRMITLVGASGVGKSSIVRAGLLPALADGAVAGSERWFVAVMSPGQDPFDSLAAAIRAVSTRPDAALEEVLEHRTRPIAAAISEAFGPAPVELVLFVDQFEELFSDSKTNPQTQKFLSALAGELAAEGTRLRVVATLRADYLAAPLEHEEFAPVFRASLVTVPPLSTAELEQAITAPAAVSGLVVEPALVRELVADSARNPMALPLLQLTLTQLFESATSMLLTEADYVKLGGLPGALTKTADALVLALTDGEVVQLRRMFGQLVASGNERSGLRKRATLESLDRLGIEPQLVARASRARLVVIDRDERSREPTVEVSHEAVLTQWPRLVEWLEADSGLLLRWSALESTAEQWEAEGRDAGGLLRERRLLEAEELQLVDPHGLTALAQDLIVASVQHRSMEERNQQSRNRRLIALASVAAGVALIALVVGAIALRLRSQAETQTAIAVEQEAQASSAAKEAQRAGAEALTAQVAAVEAEAVAEEAAASAIVSTEAVTTVLLSSAAEANARRHPALALQLAIVANARSDTPATRSALAAVRNAEPRFAGRLASIGELFCSAMSAGSVGRGALSVVTAGDPSSRTATLHSLQDGTTHGELPTEFGQAWECPIPDPSGSRLLLTNAEHLILSHLDGTTFEAPDGLKTDLASWSSDGSTVLSIGRNEATSMLTILDSNGLTVLAEIVLDNFPNHAPIDIEASAEGDTVIVADGTPFPLKVDLGSHQVERLPIASEPIRSVAIADDGSLAVGVGDQSITVWNLANDNDPMSFLLAGNTRDFAGTTGPLLRPALNPSATRVAVTTSMGLEVFDTSTGMPTGAPLDAVRSGGSTRFDGESTVVVFSLDGELERFHLDEAQPFGQSLSRADIAQHFEAGVVSTDGETATAYLGNRAVSIETMSGEIVDRGEIDAVDLIAVPSGRSITYTYETQELAVWKGSSIISTTSLAGLAPASMVTAKAIRYRDGLVMIFLRDLDDPESLDSLAIVVAIDSSKVLGVVAIPEVRRAEFKSASQLATIDLNNRVSIVDIETGATTTLPPLDHPPSALGEASNEDLLVGLADGTVVRWSVNQGRVLDVLAGPPETVVFVRETSAGSLVVQYLSGRILLWSAGETQPDGEIGAPVGLSGPAAISSDGEHVYVVASGDLLAIPLNIESWRRTACSLAGSWIDPDRWRTAVGFEPPDELPCP